MITDFYSLELIQRHNPSDISEGYRFCYIFSFWAYSTKYNAPFKYIVRAEAHEDCFAIKYYCSVNKHSKNKYYRILNLFSASETKQIMQVCASVIPLILKWHPNASFAFMGSQTFDKNEFIENRINTQRFRIYRELVRRLFGDEIFYICEYIELSSCIFINRKANPNIQLAQNRIYNIFTSIYNFEL